MGRPAFWTEKRVREAAAHYDFISDFARGNAGAHNALKTRYKHLKAELFPCFKKLKWDFESLKAEAMKYKRRVDFRNGSLGAYSRAQITGVLDDICNHMENGRLKGCFDIGGYIGKHGIYYLSLGGEVVYIGKSQYCMASRIRDHYKDKNFDEVHIFNIQNSSDLIVLETYLIAKMKPFYNIEFNSADKLSFSIDNIELIMGEPDIIGPSFGVNGLNTVKNKP